jgi:hypothetical protein
MIYVLGYGFPSLNDNQFLRRRLGEFSELNESLMKQAEILMVMRTKNEKSIKTLLNILKVIYLYLL